VVVRGGTLLLPVMLMSAGDSVRARRAMPVPDHSVFLAKPFANEDLLALVLRLTGDARPGPTTWRSSPCPEIGAPVMKGTRTSPSA
jgi:hypothetical protein